MSHHEDDGCLDEITQVSEEAGLYEHEHDYTGAWWHYVGDTEEGEAHVRLCTVNGCNAYEEVVIRPNDRISMAEYMDTLAARDAQPSLNFKDAQIVEFGDEEEQ